MGARRAYRDPTIFHPGHGGAKGKPLVKERPGLAAVGGSSHGGTAVIGFAIIATDNHAEILIVEGNRENSGGCGASHDRRFAYLPVLTSILGMKNPRRFGSARRKPDVTFAVGDEAGAAGREGPLTGQGRREGLCRKRFPIGSAICCDNQLKQPLDRVAEGHAVLLVPEGDGVKKGRRVGALELHCP